MAIEGSCYCGSVRFTVTAESPLNALYCHCVQCRKAHAAPLYSTAFVREADVTITQGADSISLCKPDPCPSWDTAKEFSRSFCGKCGSRLWNVLVMQGEGGFLPQGSYRGVFPGTFDSALPESYKPKLHVWTKEAVFDVESFQDGLPKFPRFPGMPDE